MLDLTGSAVFQTHNVIKSINGVLNVSCGTCRSSLTEIDDQSENATPETVAFQPAASASETHCPSVSRSMYLIVSKNKKRPHPPALASSSLKGMEMTS